METMVTLSKRKTSNSIITGMLIGFIIICIGYTIFSLSSPRHRMNNSMNYNRYNETMNNNMHRNRYYENNMCESNCHRNR